MKIFLSSFLTGWGDSNFEKGNAQSALEAFNQAISFNPNNVLAYISRGLIRIDLNDYKGAIEDFNQVIRIDPNYFLLILIADMLTFNWVIIKQRLKIVIAC